MDLWVQSPKLTLVHGVIGLLAIPRPKKTRHWNYLEGAGEIFQRDICQLDIAPNNLVLLYLVSSPYVFFSIWKPLLHEHLSTSWTSLEWGFLIGGTTSSEFEQIWSIWQSLGAKQVHGRDVLLIKYFLYAEISWKFQHEVNFCTILHVLKGFGHLGGFCSSLDLTTGE